MPPFAKHERRAVDIILRMKKHCLLLANVAVWFAILRRARDFCAGATCDFGSGEPGSVCGLRVGWAGGAASRANGPSKAVAIPAAVTQRLAYYKAQYGPGVLAPRGWHCFSTYGSEWQQSVRQSRCDRFASSALAWTGRDSRVRPSRFRSPQGGTSGRFEVAKVIARVFPAYKQFAQNVIAEGIEPASDFPSGPYASDKLTYRGKNIVEFETPANTAGLGTDSRLLPNASPIDGVAIITGTDTDSDSALGSRVRQRTAI